MTMSIGGAPGLLSASALESRNACAQPKRSRSTSSGLSRSAKLMPSSSALATSSWLSV